MKLRQILFGIKIDLLSFGQGSWLTTTASACHYEVGAAGFGAGAWLLYKKGNHFEPDNCLIDNARPSEGSLNVLVQTPKASVYPQPADKLVTIQFNNLDAYSTYEIKVVDGLGRTITQVKDTNPILELPTSAWVNGLYLIELHADGQSLGTQKVLIQH